jgi:glycosyltransferase involved in cell wall biosynthesis
VSVPPPPPLVTVLTPTYNRAALLPRLFASLEAQTYSGFEWLVVDDGSTDDTAEVVAHCAARARFPVRYVLRENGGKHAALNTGVAAVAGDYCAVIDSDDWYDPVALEVLRAEWETIAEPSAYAEVQGLCATSSGEIIGSRFPGGERVDSDAFEIFYRYGVRGDKIGMIRTDVMREFPFPEEFGRHYVTESLIWYRVARKYRTRYLNTVLARKEYLPGGITRSSRREAVHRAPLHRVFFKEVVQMPRPLPAKERYRAYANWARNARLAGVSLRDEMPDAPSRLWFSLAIPTGMALASRDRARLARSAGEDPEVGHER